MKQKKVLSLIMAVVLLAGVVYASTMKSEVDFVNVEESGASASALIKVSETTRDSLDRVNIKVQVKDLMSNEDEVFEGWLVDEETGYKLSIGAFLTNSRGKGILKLTQKMVNFGVYDKIVITREPSEDENPMPGNPALEAEISFDEDNDNEQGIVMLMADLRGYNEVLPTDSFANGVGWFELDKGENTLSFNISYSELEGEETEAHIHGFAPAGSSADALFTLPEGNPKVGVWNYQEGQEDQILNGMTYVNIHSSEFPGGEIRGQILEEE